MMMKAFYLTIGALLTFACTALAQNQGRDEMDVTDDVRLEVITPAEPVKETKKEIKEREKKLRELNDEAAYAMAVNSLRRGYFVFIADYIEFGNRSFRHYDINPQSNFLLVQGDDGIIQYALNTGSPGVNGLGGWTGKGAVRNKRIEEKGNGDVLMQYQIIGSKVNLTVHVTLFHNSKRTLARVMGGGMNLVFYGEIRPYRDNNHR